jgi:hypothetical protein
MSSWPSLIADLGELLRGFDASAVARFASSTAVGKVDDVALGWLLHRHGGGKRRRKHYRGRRISNTSQARG